MSVTTLPSYFKAPVGSLSDPQFCTRQQHATMTYPSSAAATVDDPDPTTQMAWPTSKRNDEYYPSPYPSPVESGQTLIMPSQTSSRTNGKSPARTGNLDSIPEENSEIGRRRLTTLQLFNLSISMAGAQIAWTVELGWI